MKKALGIGEVVLDRTYTLSSYPKEGLKVTSEYTHYSVGGPVASALILLAQLGVECTLVASVGDDQYGTELRRLLTNYDITLIPHACEKTKVNTVLLNSENASRTIIKDTVVHQPIAKIDNSIICQADVMIFDRHEPAAFSYVSENNINSVPIVFDPSTERSKKIDSLLLLSSHVIIPIESVVQPIQEIYARYKKPVIVTAGECGAYMYSGSVVEHFPPYYVQVRDTLGAGDVFRGAFAYGLLEKYPLQKNIDFANMLAALQCTKIGNGSAIPTRQEIAAFKKTAIHNTYIVTHPSIIYF